MKLELRADAAEKDPIHLLCTCNAAFNLPLCVMLVSAVCHLDRGRELVIHIISRDSGPLEKEKVRDSIERVRAGLVRIEIRWYGIDAAQLEELFLVGDSYYSADILARLFASEILPESIERAIYLDCDVVVLADLAKLYDLTAGGTSVLHAVHDIGCPRVSARTGVFDYKERGIAPEASYFNSGVMAINLKKWRALNITSRAVDYLKHNKEKIHVFDQGILNALLHDEWMALDLRWNQQHTVLNEEEYAAAGYSRKEWLRVKNHPYIVHYIGARKPWHVSHRNFPRQAYFFKYLRKTAYQGTLSHFPYYESLIGFRLYYWIWKWKQAYHLAFERPKHSAPEPISHPLVR